MKETLKEIIGKKYNDWEVLGFGRKKDNRITYRCICRCGHCDNIIRDIPRGTLKNNKSKSCGLKHKINNNFSTYTNKYDLSKKYGIGYTKNNEPFYFDKEDYDKIKKYSWSCHSNNEKYIITTKKKDNGKYERIFMHNLIMNNINKENIIDHKNRKPNDNRKNNLRIVTHSQNIMNTKLYSNNKSGVKGVYLSNDNKWKAYITFKKNRIHLGTYEDKNEAIKARLKKEYELFGKYSSQSILFDKYGIGEINEI